MGAIPYVLFWGLLIYAILTPKKHVMLYFAFGAMPFGAFGVISPTITGVTLTAGPIIMLVFFTRTFFTKGGLDLFTSLSLSKNRLLLLFVFWMIGIFTTLTMPVFFAGDIEVIPMRGESLSETSLLAPSIQNFTQLIYISISILSVYSFTVFFKNPTNRQLAMKAVCIASVLCILTGILDYLNQFITLDFIIEPFKNASYALVDQQILDAKRINGFMPEPSVYSDLSINLLTTLYFFRRTIEERRIREFFVPILIILLFCMVWISTSSSGLVALAILICLIFLEWFSRLSTKNKVATRGLKTELWIFNIILICLLATILFDASLFDPVVELFEKMVFSKTDSQSFEERSMWTAVSWQALIDSYGIGIGFGSTRASNNAVALISSVGFIGAIFFYSFLLQCYLRKPIDRNNDADMAMITAFRWSFIPPFIVSLLIGTNPDFGLFNAFRFGLILAIAIFEANNISNKKMGDNRR